MISSPTKWLCIVIAGRWLAAADKHRFCVCKCLYITIGNIGGRIISSPTKRLFIVIVGRWLAAAVKLSTYPRKIHHVSAIFRILAQIS